MELKARDLKSGLGPAYLETAAWDPKGNGKLECVHQHYAQCKFGLTYHLVVPLR